MSTQRGTIAGEWVRIVAGLLVFGFGVHLTIRANIGLAPWDCLGMGISYHTPLSYGLSMTAMSVAILVVVLLVGFLLGGPVGIGTLVSTFGAGAVMQLVFDALHFEPRTVVHRDVPQVLADWRQ